MLLFKSMSVDHKQEIVKHDCTNGEINLKDYGKSIFLGTNLNNEDIISCISAYRKQQAIQNQKLSLYQKVKKEFLRLVA